MSTGTPKMKYQCMTCDHQFEELGKTYADLDIWCTKAIGACPQCLSDDYTEVSELKFKVPERITVRPVTMDENIGYRRDMIEAGRGHLLK